ncbi:oligoribonuclease [Photobacterium sp. ZSDE20]|uniref:Oligoribonuclease n=1 Tax=Photobacterium pectinilyticum TaxID=2906793 RepID=A0ABT1N6D8_9GAMM|nr:oligoribonuclease [Photobacterium sp. ZSDE20]MCQ1060286.1 oligoribonuclease [Photobacterium sp. ZSDE20]MDD1826273.1 oligoribonuclease [Photobacterium sp. ZSDE20]
MIVWIDLETTGFNTYSGEVHGARHNLILSMGIVVTDENLNFLHEGKEIFIKHSDELLQERLTDWAREHHSKSGLLDNCSSMGVSMAIAEQEVIKYLESLNVEKFNLKTKKGAVIAGNNIQFDRSFINAQMKELDRWFHYRMLDVSALAMAARFWQPDVEKAVEKQYLHTALEDIKESIQEARFYKHALFSLNHSDAEVAISLAQTHLTLDHARQLAS